jgi:integrase
VPGLAPADAPLPRERAKRPYSHAEIDGYLALADAQPAVTRRMRASALVCLGAGAGVIRSDLRHVRGSDVICRSRGVVVQVRGARPRAVPVLARYQDRLLASAAFAGGQLIAGGATPPAVFGKQQIEDPALARVKRARTTGHTDSLPATAPHSSRHYVGGLRSPAPFGPHNA